MANDDEFYAAVADEIARGHIDQTLWTKAFANSGGEETATKSLYCRLRAEQLQSAARKQHRCVQIAFTKAHAKQLGFGLLAFLIGMALTAVSYSAAKPGGHYFFTYGLIVGGFLAICKGLSGLVRSQFMRSPPATAHATAFSGSSESEAQTTTANQHTQLAQQPGPAKTASNNGCVIALLIGLGLFILLVVMGGDPPPPATQQQSASVVQPTHVTQQKSASVVQPTSATLPAIAPAPPEPPTRAQQVRNLQDQINALDTSLALLAHHLQTAIPQTPDEIAEYRRRQATYRETLTKRSAKYEELKNLKREQLQ